jgi:single-stranded DNA-binding protein
VTKLQRYVFGIVSAHHLRDRWYRAASSGERVTLASLYRAGALTRRPWRGNEGEADAAYEYRLTEVADQALRQMLAAPSTSKP